MNRRPNAAAVAAIIDALGLTPLSRALGHRYVTTVAGWKARGHIPPFYWKQIIAYAAERGEPISYETLVEAHQPEPSDTPSESVVP